MFKILFVCHGNICRSPMAEFITADLIKKRGIDGVSVASAATSTEELGDPVYPPAKRMLEAHSISCAGKTARQITRRDYAEYDLLIGMDRQNVRNMHRMLGGDPDGKIRLLLDFTDAPGEVSDPWYTRDFDRAWDDIERGCRGLLDHLENNGIVRSK